MAETSLGEHPSSRWLDADPIAAIARAYDLVEGAAADALAWYQRAMVWRGRIARLLRFLALIAFGIGGLLPLAKGLLPAVTIAGVPEFSWMDAGYVSLATGTALLGFDHFFGITSAYTRFVTTATALQLARTRFQSEWLLLVGKERPKDAWPTALEERLRAYTEQVAQLVERETRQWVAEFRSSLSELENLGGRGRAAPPTLEPHAPADAAIAEAGGPVLVKPASLATGGGSTDRRP